MEKEEIIYIGSGIFYDHKLNLINEDIKKWDLELVSGNGIYRRQASGKFGHVEFEMSGNDNDSKTSSLFWELGEEKIPNEFRPTIEKVLRFFVGYLAGIKGERVYLNFRIKNGSFHEVDSSEFHYEIATIIALLDCFNKLSSIPGSNTISRN